MKCFVCCVMPRQPQLLEARRSHRECGLHYFNLHLCGRHLPPDPELYEALELSWRCCVWKKKQTNKKKLVRTGKSTGLKAITATVLAQTIFNESSEVVGHSTHVCLTTLVVIVFLLVFVAVKNDGYWRRPCDAFQDHLKSHGTAATSC